MRPDALAHEVAQLITPHLPEAAGLDADAIADLLAPPPKPELGDFAFPCFPLARTLRNAPAKIAASLAEQLGAGLAEAGEDTLIAAVTAAGPYLNFELRPHLAARVVLPSWARGESPRFASADQKVMVEYSQPNTHKAFHVGHMRNLCLGDALVRLLRAAGHEVVAANYLGDVGTHVAKCLWGLEALDVGEPPSTGRGEWLGAVYSKASNALADWEQAAKPVAEGGKGDAEAEAKYASARARMSEILKGIETRDPEYHQLWLKTRQWSLDEFDEIYAWVGVEFDRVFYESEVDEPGLQLVDEFLQKGVFVVSRGAVGIENPEIKHMPFFMLRKTDGTGLYATKDLALARMKFEEYGVDRSIYVVDARQSDHFKQVFLTLEKMGFAQAALCEHVAYEMVELPDGPMSSRKGNVILFRALREQLAAALERSWFHQYRGEWSDEEMAAALHQVSLGAIKFGMLARDNNQKIVFDMDKWTQVEGGDGGPYLQYVTARSGSLLAKASARDKQLDAALLSGAEAPAAGTLTHPYERGLMMAIVALPAAVAKAAETLRPSILCAQIFSLAKAYNRFQQDRDCNVIHQDDPEVLGSRLLLVKAAREALVWGLSLLGVPAVARM